MDSYARGETYRPSDNLAAVVASAEMRGGTGKNFLTALAVSYQVQTRLSDPERDKEFDQGVCVVAAGLGKALDLSRCLTLEQAEISDATGIFQLLVRASWPFFSIQLLSTVIAIQLD